MIKIIRDLCGPQGTLGYTDLDPSSGRGGEPVRIYTLERPWVPVVVPAAIMPTPPPCGQKGISCIPPGIYNLEMHSTEAHPDTFALVNRELWVYHWDTDVPPERRGYARTVVLIHPANWVEELRGCIAPGLSRGSLRAPSVLASRRAFSILHDWLEIRGQQIEISNG